MKKENENAALLSMFDELVNEVKKNRQAILQLQNTIQQYDVGKIVDVFRSPKQPKTTRNNQT